MALIKLGTGRTTPGSTAWQPYNAGTTGIYVDVSTTAAGFSGTPVYLTSIGGTSGHWATTGATSIYPTPGVPMNQGFRIYVRWADGSSLTPAQANSWSWHISWAGIEP
jgi:hypothetical protein